MFREAFPILYVSDIERSVRFYQDLFGFVKVYQWPMEASPDYVYLTLGSVGLGLSAPSVAESLHGQLVCRHDSPRFELCLYAEDVDEASEYLKSKGATQLTPPMNMPWGERVAYFADPDGNPIHITAQITHPDDDTVPEGRC